MNWQSIKTVAGRLIALSLLGAVSPAASAVEISQISPRISVDCAVELNQTTKFTIKRLSALSDAALWSSNQPQQAAYYFRQLLQQLDAIEDVELKTRLFAQYVYGETVGVDLSVVDRVNLSLLQKIVVQAIAIEQPDLAYPLLAQTLEILASLGHDTAGLQAAALTALAKEYGILQQPEQARYLLNQALTAANTVASADRKTVILLRIAEQYLAMGETEVATVALTQALQTAREIKHSPVAPERRMLRIIDGYVQAGALEQALKTAQSIPYPIIQADAIATIATHYLQTDRLAQTLKFAEMIEYSPTKVEILAQLGARYTALNQPDQADILFERVIEVAQSDTTHENTPHYALMSASKAYAHSGQPDVARTLAERFSHMGYKAGILGEIAGVHLDAGQPDTASLVLSQAISTVQPGHRASLGEDFFHNYLVAGQYELALQTVQELYSELVDRLDDKLLTLVQKAADAEQYEVAFEVIAALPDDRLDLKNQSLQTVAIAYIQTGNHDLAIQTAESITNPARRTDILVAVVNAYANTGQSDRAVAWLDSALQLVRTASFANLKDHAQALTALAIQSTRLGRTQQGTGLREEAWQLVQNHQAETNTRQTNSDLVENVDHVLRAMANQYLQTAQYQVAIDIAQAMSIAKRSEYLEKIFWTAIKDNRYDMALAAIDAIPIPAEKTQILLKLADHYLRLEQFTQTAESLAQAFEVAQTIPDPESRFIVIGGREFNDTTDRGSLLEEIALYYAQMGDETQALNVAGAIEDRANREQLQQRVGCYAAYP